MRPSSEDRNTMIRAAEKETPFYDPVRDGKARTGDKSAVAT